MKAAKLQKLYRTLSGPSAQPQAGLKDRPMFPGSWFLVKPSSSSIFRLAFFSQTWTLQSAELREDVCRQNVHCRTPGTDGLLLTVIGSDPDGSVWLFSSLI